MRLRLIAGAGWKQSKPEKVVAELPIKIREGALQTLMYIQKMYIQIDIRIMFSVRNLYLWI